jgi:hypothetical protein
MWFTSLYDCKCEESDESTSRRLDEDRVSDARTRLLGTTSRCRPTSRGDSSDERNEHRRAGVEESERLRPTGRLLLYTSEKQRYTRVRGRDESDQL